MQERKLPVEIENLEEIRKMGFYCVDKTGLIVDLLNSWGKVNLVTCPRRFGKTLIMSMLQHFFKIGADAFLFDGLKIAEHEQLYDGYMGKFPVVTLSLKSVDRNTYEEAVQKLGILVLTECQRLTFLEKVKMPRRARCSIRWTEAMVDTAMQDIRASFRGKM